MQLISVRTGAQRMPLWPIRANSRKPNLSRDLTGSYASLHTYATLDGFDVNPLNAGSSEAKVQTNLNWSSVVGSFQDVRTLRVIKAGDRSQVVWPINREAKVPPQVIPVNYLRWESSTEERKMTGAVRMSSLRTFASSRCILSIVGAVP